MNINEAIEQLKIDKELAKRDYISPTNHEEYDLAIEALEKQIPKKPIEQMTRRDNVRIGICVSCKKWWIDQLDHYCPKCGQVIDWSVEE